MICDSNATLARRWSSFSASSAFSSFVICFSLSAFVVASSAAASFAWRCATETRASISACTSALAPSAAAAARASRGVVPASNAVTAMLTARRRPPPSERSVSSGDSLARSSCITRRCFCFCSPWLILSSMDSSCACSSRAQPGPFSSASIRASSARSFSPARRSALFSSASFRLLCATSSRHTSGTTFRCSSFISELTAPRFHDFHPSSASSCWYACSWSSHTDSRRTFSSSSTAIEIDRRPAPASRPTGDGVRELEPDASSKAASSVGIAAGRAQLLRPQCRRPA